jgi:hypothetical protein
MRGTRVKQMSKSAEAVLPKYEECICCKQPFNTINTFTEAGWKETQTSGMCETCFDELFEDMEQE